MQMGSIIRMCTKLNTIGLNVCRNVYLMAIMGGVYTMNISNIAYA